MEPGTRLGHYEILAPLGEGGMGQVYRARDTTLDRDVAIKVLPEDFATDPARLARFDVEAKAVAGINHPNIVTIYSIEEMNGRRVLTMELVEGRSLDDAIPPDGLSIREFFPIAEALAEALVAAHDRGIAHRDLKPANVMLSNDNRVKVLDFGLAKLLAPDDAQQATQMPTRALTGEGVMVGTVPYMSPEQLEGRVVDHRTDIFSLGVLLYEMATGQRPFQGNSVAATSSAILRDTPAPVTERKRELPRHLGRIISRCLQKNPDQRSQSARDVLSELVGLRREIDSGEHPDSAAPRQAPAPEVQTAHLPTTTHSIAVLPFENMSPDPEQQYFCDGMAEEVMSALGAVKDLRVAARTSAFMFRGAAIDIAEVGDKLHVGTVLMGSVRKFGNRLRITAQLVDVAEGYQLWSERYDRDMEDVFEIQDQIARAIVGQLQVQLGVDSDAPIIERATQSLEAYNLYLKGRFHWARLTPTELNLAIEYFQRAVEIDPEYAQAWVALALTLASATWWGGIRPHDAYPRAREAAQTALAIDESIADAHANLGVAAYAYDFDWQMAETHMVRAVEFDAASPDTRYLYWELLMILKQHEEAEVQIEIACELDPLSCLYRGEHAFGALCMGDFKRALQLSEQARNLDPGHFHPHWIDGWALRELGRIEESTAAFERAVELSGGDPISTGHLALNHLQFGDAAKGQQLVSELRERSERERVSEEVFYLAARLSGDIDTAIEWLAKAHEVRDAVLPWMRVIPLDAFGFADEPRIEAFFDEIGLP